MTIKQLEYFMAVAETLSFTKAAQWMFVSQPSLSRSLADLEQELDLRLLTRDHHTVELTAAGQTLYNDLVRLGKSFRQSLVKAQGVQSGLEGTLRLGLLYGQALPKCVQSALVFLDETLPKIYVDLRRLDFAQLLAGLADGSLDMIMTMDFEVAPLADQVQWTQLEEYPNHMVLPGEHPLGKEKELPLAAFKNETFIVIGSDSSSGNMMAQSCRDVGFEPKLRTVPDIQSQLLRIEVGGGVGTFNVMHQACNTPGLVHVPVTDFPPQRRGAGLAAGQRQPLREDIQRRRKKLNKNAPGFKK